MSFFTFLSGCIMRIMEHDLCLYIDLRNGELTLIKNCLNQSIYALNFLPMFYPHWHKFPGHVISRLWRGLHEIMRGTVKNLRKCRSTRAVLLGLSTAIDCIPINAINCKVEYFWGSIWKLWMSFTVTFKGRKQSLPIIISIETLLIYYQVYPRFQVIVVTI